MISSQISGTDSESYDRYREPIASQILGTDRRSQGRVCAVEQA
jgi:hypothetical protein